MSNSYRARRARARRSASNALDLGRPLVVAILARVSLDKDGEGKSVGDQVEEGEEVLTWQETWVLDRDRDLYVDNSISASKYADGKERPEWLRLWEAVKTGRIDIVITWEVSRLSRMVLEGLNFLEDCIRAGTRIYVVSEEKLCDPEDSSDYDWLLEELRKAAGESAQKSKRLGRGARKMRSARGRQNGRCPYGYVRRYLPDPEGGPKPLVVQEIVPAEAAVIVWAFTKAGLQGWSVSRLLTHLNAPGDHLDCDGRRGRGQAGTGHCGRPAAVPLATRPGKKKVNKRGDPINKYGMWSRSTMTGILTNPVYIAKITKEASYGTENRDLREENLIDCARAEDGSPVYPRIIEDGLFFAAVANLRARSGRGYNGGDEQRGIRPGAAAHLMTHLAVCGACGAPMTPGDRVYQSAVQPGAAAQAGVNAVKGRKGFQKLPEGTVRERKVARYYRCAKVMHVNVQEPAADEYVVTLVLDKLCELARLGGLRGKETQELVSARAELDDAAEFLADARSRARKRKLSLDALEGIEAEYAPMIEELQERVRQLGAGVVLYPFMSSSGDLAEVAKVWDSLALEGKRSVLRELAESIRMYPAKHAGRCQGDVSERIEVIWNPVYVVSGDTVSAADSGTVIPCPED